MIRNLVETATPLSVRYLTQSSGCSRSSNFSFSSSVRTVILHMTGSSLLLSRSLFAPWRSRSPGPPCPGTNLYPDHERPHVNGHNLKLASQVIKAGTCPLTGTAKTCPSLALLMHPPGQPAPSGYLEACLIAMELKGMGAQLSCPCRSSSCKGTFWYP